MKFKNRNEAGQLLAQKLKQYKNKNVIVYALPRGGIMTAIEIAHFLHAPLDLVIVRKIGHPYQPEYAIAAIAEDGYMLGEQHELAIVNQKWLEKAMEEQRQEIKRRREKYLQGKACIPVQGKVAILVDDGVATGFTMRVAIQELKHRQPEKIIVAVPVVSDTTAQLIKREAGEIVAMEIPADDEYLGAVGAYYDDFTQVEDEDVISIMQEYEKEYQSTNSVT